MSLHIHTIYDVLVILLCAQTIRQSVCPNFCCSYSQGGQEIICDGAKCETCEILDVYSKSEETLKIENMKKLIQKSPKVGIKDLTVERSMSDILLNLIDKQKSVESLKLIDIELNPNWKLGLMFQQLTQLKDFHLESTKLPEVLTIDEDNGYKIKSIDNNNYKTIISFTIIKCEIKSINTNLMNKWINLRMISLANNRIENLNRSWFSPTLDSLWSLDLSYNFIQTIPKHFFKGMGGLRKLRLDNNALKTLHDYWFDPIWDGLHELWIEKNQITCNPDLSWIPNATHPTFFDGGECYSEIQSIRYFHELRNYDSDITPPT